MHTLNFDSELALWRFLPRVLLLLFAILSRPIFVFVVPAKIGDWDTRLGGGYFTRG